MKLSDEKPMNTEDVAHYLRRSPGAIRNLVMRCCIPFRKVAGRLIFLKSEITEWINDAPGVRLKDLSNE